MSEEIKRIVFATNNQHKLKEIQSILGNHFQLISLKEAGIDCDIPENQATLEGNALEKAKFVFDRLGLPCFADDTGLEVTALNGEPGVFSARYAGAISDYGTDEKRSLANMEKLLSNLFGKTDRSARFRTIIAYLDGNSEYFFEGIVNGTIIENKFGTQGFGYDPIFVPEGHNITFAEMNIFEKNKISHRARAFNKFIDFLKK